MKQYFQLTKPGIIFGNAITAIAGFALASRGHFDIGLFIAMLLGLSCVIASACVCNNYIDREMDGKMARTKNRALAKGEISVTRAFVFAAALLVLGVSVLVLYANFLTALMALLGFSIYVFLYSPWKYRSWHATLIGSIAGGMPPVVGYCAVGNTFDLGAFLLFVIVVLWQMPHFFAIAMYRMSDYAAASIPVLPIVRGMQVAKIQILLYMIAFCVAALLLTFFGFTGYAYLVATGILSLAWLWKGFKGFKASNDKLWARKVFLHSLVVIMGLSLMIFVDRF